MDLKFYTLDVFSDKVFGGNPLAIFPEADLLSDDLMQSIAQRLIILKLSLFKSLFQNKTQLK